MSRTRVLVADAPTPWHQELLDALGQDAGACRISASGKELAEALAGTDRQVVLVGDGLTELSGLDALYAAHLARAKVRNSGPRSGPITLLIFDARADTELLALLRARGVDGFIRRNEPVEEVAARIRSCLYVEQRVAPRQPIKAKAKIEIGGQKLAGQVEDLSIGGAQLVLPAKKLTPLPPIGTQLELETEVAAMQLKLTCAIRRLDVRKGLLGDRIALGVAFVSPDFDQQKSLETVLALLSSVDDDRELSRHAEGRSDSWVR